MPLKPRPPVIESLVLFHHLCNRPRPRRCPLPYLTDGLISEILLRLPGPSVSLLRSVSKRWLSITSDRGFLLSHRRRHHSLSGFFLFPLNRSPAFFQLGPPFCSLPPAFPPNSVVLHSLSNNLLLYQTKSHPKDLLFVLNLRTWAYTPVPRRTARRRLKGSRHVIISGSSGHFKVVSFKGRKTHAYSSEAGSWKSLFRPSTPGEILPRCVYWDGSLVWANERSNLFRLDVDGEFVETVRWPEDERKGCQCHYLGESGGRLHLVLSSHQRMNKLARIRFEVFGMDSLRSGWSVVHRVDLKGIKEVYHEVGDGRDESLRVSIVHFYRGGGKEGKGDRLFLSIPGKIVCYDLQDKTFTIVADNVIPQNEGVQNSDGETEYRFFQFHPLELSFL